MNKLKSGLSFSEVLEREKNGQKNIDSSVKPKPVSEIFKKNFFTLFNFINFILALMIIFTGSFKNLVFMFIVIINSFISFVQELRASAATQKLKLISSSNSKVIRNSKEININPNEIVKDDIIILKAGDQVVVDCIIGEGNCEVNESLLTGESDLITKKIGDYLLSGSFIVSGKVIAVANKVGKHTYSAKISRGLKNIHSAKSEIMLAVQKIIKLVSFIIFPVGIPFFLSQMKSNNYNYSIAALATSAALIGMIPEGLALLTSSVLALGATRLAKKKILAKDVYSVESLARIDTLCLDKTGTITEGKFEVKGTVSYKNLLSDNIKIGDFGDIKLLTALEILSSAFETGNDTFNAIKNKFGKKKHEYKIKSVIPFASHRKFSAVYLKDIGSLIMGSAEFIFKNNFYKFEKLISKYSDYRVLSVAHSKSEITQDNINNNNNNNNINFLGIVILSDKIRKDAIETIDYFEDHKVDVKIISGDNADTISKVAKTVGIKNYDKAIDTSKLEKKSDIFKAVSKYTIFARVTPEKKREIIMAMKTKGKRVAMIGDGVNDILALKEADCSVAMASGSSAAREISHLILMNSDFSAIKDAVFEGRRAINNIQTTSSLFLVRTIYSAILAVLLVFFSIPYPFAPIQMTLINTLTVGIPSFLISLEPNTSEIKKSLFSNIVKISVPAAIAICINIILCFLSKYSFDIPQEIYSSISVATTAIISFRLLWKICQPLNFFRAFIFVFLTLSFIFIFMFYGNLFSLVLPSLWGIKYLIISCIVGFLSCVIYNYLSK